MALGFGAFLGCRVWAARPCCGAARYYLGVLAGAGRWGWCWWWLLRDWLKKDLPGVLRALQRYAEIGRHDVLLEPHQHLQGPGPRQDRTACREHSAHVGGVPRLLRGAGGGADGGGSADGSWWMCSTCCLAATRRTWRRFAARRDAGRVRPPPPRGLLLLLVGAAAAHHVGWSTLLPETVRGAVNHATQAAPAGENYFNLLPQADEHDRAAFLSQYFGLENKDWVKRLLADEPGTSRFCRTIPPVPTPPRCSAWTQETTFYRKYAFGADGDKLAEQLAWLRAQQEPPAAVRHPAKQHRGQRLLLV